MMDDAVSARRRQMLQSALGPKITASLADERVIEVMVNPDGALRLDILGKGCIDTGVRVNAAQVERIIRLVATQARGEISTDCPIISAELPHHNSGSGERFEGVLPPVSKSPCFSIRKAAARIFKLRDYVDAGMCSADCAQILSRAVADRLNILVAGGTSSGKTTLANALLDEMAGRNERVVIIEDTRELQCPATDRIELRSCTGSVTIADLVRSTLRLRPDRIVVGEVRGGEALDMLKAWNTGHPGGIATLHANSAASALVRLEQLVQERVPVVPPHLIADAIDIVVFISGRGLARRISSVTRVKGLAANGRYRLSDLALKPNDHRERRDEYVVSRPHE